MDEERLSNLGQRVREDSWPVTVAPPAVVRRRAEQRQQRRAIGLAFTAAITVPAAVALLASVSSGADRSEPDDRAPQVTITQSAQPSAVPTTTPTTTPSPTLRFNAPADRALATSLLATDELPKDFVALPSCCYYEAQETPADETDCDTRRREGVAGPAGRTAQAMLPIRYTGAAPALTDVSLTQELATYASTAAAIDAMARQRETLDACRATREIPPDVDATSTVDSVATASVGDESVLWTTSTRLRSPTPGTHVRYDLLLRSGTTLQLVSLFRTPTRSQSVESNERADLIAAEDFARRGLAKLKLR